MPVSSVIVLTKKEYDLIKKEKMQKARNTVGKSGWTRHC